MRFKDMKLWPKIKIFLIIIVSFIAYIGLFHREIIDVMLSGEQVYQYQPGMSLDGTGVYPNTIEPSENK
ncbi:hypothetical protein CS063_08650 [Sporanaerobium hydrogeniformans]|uniref:Uncharacterized protein n=1 Tax=Sporanaerobium hydrogeniformans TaxID=3072179 RepID=A0AC61DDF0_9FIRM|nr:hypothetical protein [Sporanaerobium hydrogeniformans]PHV70825.1 hypothetical protein CS063_08650 [Sporanaerobium hydrogeniformans]